MLGVFFQSGKKTQNGWSTDSEEKGFVTYTCCINDGYLSKDWVGRKIDKSFLEELPSSVRPMWRKQPTFHSLCTEGPIFKQPISIAKGEIVYRLINLPILVNFLDS